MCQRLLALVGEVCNGAFGRLGEGRSHTLSDSRDA